MLLCRNRLNRCNFERKMWWKILIALAVTGLFALGGTYWYVDRRVTSRLAPETSGLIPAIYSDSLRFTRQDPPRPKLLKEQLAKRRYLEVQVKPEHPGEFIVRSDSIEVVTRPFRGADGAEHPSRRVAVPFSGEFKVTPPEDSFELEPLIIATLGNGDVRASNYKKLQDIPKSIKQAVLAIEDQRFYDHFGLDLEGIFRALVQNIKARSFVQGGSTITQQLAKNSILSPARTLSRKFLEVFAAISLERHLTKDEILERYLNDVYLGQEGSVSIHGVDEAANTYFGKKLVDISLPEAALLAAIIKGPSYYSPRKHLKRALLRRDLVLDKMQELKYISAEQQQSARRARLSIAREGRHRRSAPYFISAVKRDVDADLNLDAALLSGLTIFTGLNPDLQTCAEQAISQGISTIEKENPSVKTAGHQLEAALVSIEPYSGKIRALVGGRDFSVSQFNHAIQAKRQIGSTVKPFLYLTALDPRLNTYKVATTTSILSDQPMQVNLETKDIWEPENYDHEYRGDVTLRYALENSLNMPAIYVAQKVGIPTVAETLKRFRVADSVPAVPALALGALDTTLLDLTAAYAALANGGIYVTPRMYLAATDTEGEQLTSKGISEERVSEEAPVFVLTNILQGVVERGTGAGIRRSGYRGPAAGKTGTSNDTRDAWFVGFTPTLSTGVWVGFDDDSKTGLTGGRAAAPIWAAYMKCAGSFLSEEQFVAPAGVTFVSIDSESGQLAASECPAEHTIREVFVRGTEPKEICRIHSRYEEQPHVEDTSPPPATPERERRRRRSVWDMLFG